MLPGQLAVDPSAEAAWYCASYLARMCHIHYPRAEHICMRHVYSLLMSASLESCWEAAFKSHVISDDGSSVIGE